MSFAGSKYATNLGDKHCAFFLRNRFFTFFGSKIRIKVFQLLCSDEKDIIRKTCQRTFQALRIDVNHEFEVLYEFMEKLPGTLKPGGRVAILTFHSGEDKLVKKALKAGYREGVYSEYAKDVVRPSAEECAQNGRARSTKMRWAVKAE